MCRCCSDLGDTVISRTMRHQPSFWIYRVLLLLAFSTLGLVLLSTVRYGGVPQEITRVSVVTEIHSGESYADRSAGMENVLHGLQNGSLRDQRQRVGDTGREREYSVAQHFRLHTLEATLTLGVCGNPQKFLPRSAQGNAVESIQCLPCGPVLQTVALSNRYSTVQLSVCDPSQGIV